MSETNNSVEEEEGERKHHVLDDELVNSLRNVPEEDSVLTQFGGAGGSEGRFKEVSDWMPDENEMKDETRISPSQAKAMAVAPRLAALYPDAGIDHLMPIIEAIIRDEEKYAVSIYGDGREQQAQVLRSMFHPVSDNDEEFSGRNMINLFNGDKDNDE